MPEKRAGLLEKSLLLLLLTLGALSVTFFFFRILHANQTTVALSYLTLIIFTAFGRPLVYSLYLSLLCTVLYNVFFLPPVGSFTIADPQNLVALIAFLAAAVSVGQISARENRNAAALKARQQEVERLYEYSQRLLLRDATVTLSREIPGLIAETFGIPAVAFYAPSLEAGVLYDPEGRLHGMEDLQHATQADEVAGRSYSGIRIVPLMLGMRALGALAMAESGYSENLYDAIGGLTAIAFERASALERTSRTEAAREGEVLRSALLDSITHELRTPLTGIRMAATTLLGAHTLDENARLDLAMVVNEESLRLDRLIDEAVVMAQLTAGEVHLRKQQCSFGEILDPVLATLSTALRGREVEIRLPSDLPRVAMDPDLVRRTMKHLIENALQYSPSGTAIGIAAQVQRGRLCVAVEDHGFGIPEEERSLIFDRFFRGSHQGVNVKGTGMGLAIVKTIVEAHQGAVHVESTLGQGTTFSFSIPLETGAKDHQGDILSRPGDTSAATPGD